MTWTAGQYFEALGVPLKRGRFFTDADGRSGGRVLIVSEMLAKLVERGELSASNARAIRDLTREWAQSEATKNQSETVGDL